jgi:hypothetical protein
MSNKSSEKSEMSELTWASLQMHERIAPRGSVKQRIRDAARVLGWKHSRARTIWYADERASIKPRELRRIEEVAGIEYGRQELRSVEALIARADALASNEVDEGVYSAFAAAFRAFIGALDRTGTRGE